jgi:hypothetical protein
MEFHKTYQKGNNYEINYSQTQYSPLRGRRAQTKSRSPKIKQLFAALIF